MDVRNAVGLKTTETVRGVRDLRELASSRKPKLRVAGNKLLGERISSKFKSEAQGNATHYKIVPNLDDCITSTSDELGRHVRSAIKKGNDDYFSGSPVKAFFELALNDISEQAPGLQKILDTIYRNFDDYKERIAEA